MQLNEPDLFQISQIRRLNTNSFDKHFQRLSAVIYNRSFCNADTQRRMKELARLRTFFRSYRASFLPKRRTIGGIGASISSSFSLKYFLEVFFFFRPVKVETKLRVAIQVIFRTAALKRARYSAVITFSWRKILNFTQ